MSSNLIGVPFKATAPVPLASALVDLIASTSSTTHPDAIAADAKALDELRVLAVGKQGELQLEQGTVDALIGYYQHLTSSLSKLPTSGLPPFPWFPLFSSSSTVMSVGSFSSTSVKIPSLQFERANILLNLGAAHSAMAVQTRRADEEGIKASIASFQNAAGCFSHLLTLLPALAASSDYLHSPDLSRPTIESLRDLMLVQAQEVFWQKGVMDRLKNGTISKLALAASNLYSSALAHAHAAKSGAFSFPESLINHVTVKSLHFGAVAQYRKSIDDLGANRYGDELGRLEIADGLVKKALAGSKRGVADSVMKDLKGLGAILTDNLTRARKDNSLIYLESPTPLSSLAAITPATMSRATPPPALSQPPRHILFSSLQPYVVHSAFQLYLDRRSSFLSEQLTQPSADFAATEARTLSALGLPGSLDASTQPVGLPPTLKERAREVRAEGGAERLRGAMKDVRRVARVAARALSEASALLAQEAELDSSMRGRWGTERWTRPPAQGDAEGAQRLEKVHQFEQVLQKAGESDGLVRGKFGEWEARLTLLSGPEEDLERGIPRIDISSGSAGGSNEQALAFRRLRSLLDDLASLRSERESLIGEAKYALSASSGDDSQARGAIVAESGRLERAKAAASKVDGGGKEGVGLEQFEDVLERELKKFAGLGRRMRDLAARGEDLLDNVKTANAAFVQLRATSPALAQREQALQELDSAYHMFREILTNLQEGLKFYADLGRMTGEVKEGVKAWTAGRSVEAQELAREAELSSGVQSVRISTSASAGGAEEGSQRTEQGRAWRPEDGIRFG